MGGVVTQRDGTARGFICDGETLDALRRSLLVMMSDWSEGAYAAGWMSGTEEMLHDQAGAWEILGNAIGWPSGYEHDADFRWLTWDEAGELFRERKARRGY